jgi:hypothetical protein
MAERSPIYSAKTGRQQIGYIEDDEAFDLFGRACAIYDSGTGLLRDPNNNLILGYISLTNIFVGASGAAEQLFPKAVRSLPPQEGRDDQACDARGSWLEHVDAEDVDACRPDGLLRPPQEAIKTDTAAALSNVEETDAPQESAAQELASHVTNMSAVADPPRRDEVAGSAFPVPASIHLENLSNNQLPQFTRASVPTETPGETESGDPSRAVAYTPTARAAQSTDVGPVNVAPSDDSAVDSRRPDEHLSGGDIPPAVETFMRRLAEYLGPNAHQAATPRSLPDGDAVPELSASSNKQRHTDRASLLDKRYAGERDLLTAGDDLALQGAEEAPVATEPAQGEPVGETVPAQGEPVVENEPAQGIVEMAPAATEQAPAGEQSAATEEQPLTGDQTSSRERPLTETQFSAEDGICEKPPPIPLVAGEAWARPILSAQDHTDFESVVPDGSLGDAGNVGRPSSVHSEFAPKDGADTAPSLALCEQAPVAQSNALEPDDSSDQDNAPSGEYFDRSSSEVDEAPLSNDSPGEPGPDLTQVFFFDVDVERAVAIARNELGLRNTVPGGTDSDLTGNLFSVDVQRAVNIVRDELEKTARPTGHADAVGTTDTTDPTKEIFSTEMDRILEAVLRELEKKPR